MLPPLSYLGRTIALSSAFLIILQFRDTDWISQISRVSRPTQPHQARSSSKLKAPVTMAFFPDQKTFTEMAGDYDAIP
ncbi:hypothetical protein N9990_00445, partial [bacterium]|nr:hypothetical protein [bacterium]